MRVVNENFPFRRQENGEFLTKNIKSRVQNIDWIPRPRSRGKFLSWSKHDDGIGKPKHETQTSSLTALCFGSNQDVKRRSEEISLLMAQFQNQ